MPAPHVQEVLGQHLLVTVQRAQVPERTSQWVTAASQIVNQPNRHDQEGPF